MCIIRPYSVHLLYEHKWCITRNEMSHRSYSIVKRKVEICWAYIKWVVWSTVDTHLRILNPGSRMQYSEHTTQHFRVSGLLKWVLQETIISGGHIHNCTNFLLHYTAVFLQDVTKYHTCVVSTYRTKNMFLQFRFTFNVIRHFVFLINVFSYQIDVITYIFIFY